MKKRYTCAEYREEMRLLELRRRLGDSTLGEEERQSLEREIKELEARMDMA